MGSRRRALQFGEGIEVEVYMVKSEGYVNVGLF